jgi:hypothetical protein
VAAPIVCRIAEALPVKAEEAKQQDYELRVNPDWVKAEYEELYFYSEHAYAPLPPNGDRITCVIYQKLLEPGVWPHRMGDVV